MPSRQLDKHIKRFRDGGSVWRGKTFRYYLKPRELSLEGGCIFHFLNVFITKFLSNKKKELNRREEREQFQFHL